MLKAETCLRQNSLGKRSNKLREGCELVLKPGEFSFIKLFPAPITAL